MIIIIIIIIISEQKNYRTEERSRQKNSRRDRKGESNDSPEIQDRVVTSDIPSLPSGGHYVG